MNKEIVGLIVGLTTTTGVAHSQEEENRKDHQEHATSSSSFNSIDHQLAELLKSLGLTENSLRKDPEVSHTSSDLAPN